MRRTSLQAMIGDKTAAEEDLSIARTLAPLTYQKDGIALFHQGLFAPALDKLNTTVRLLEVSLKVDSQWRKLIGRSDNAHRVDFNAIYGYLWRARVRENLSDFQGAIADYRRFLEIGGDTDWDADLIREKLKSLIAFVMS